MNISNIDSSKLTEDLNNRGYAIVPNILTEKDCDILVSEYNNAALYRKTVIMERHQYGLGEYKYFNYPLPAVIEQLRTGIYPLLAPVANNWMKVLNIDMQFPATQGQLLEHCHAEGQLKATPLILQYSKSGYNALHQDLYGDVFFPM
ncbi:MAG: 2OG-Fe(II) oxygenase, partial [Mucilaginibacter sp.]